MQIDEDGQVGDPTVVYTDKLGLEGNIHELQVALDADGDLHLAWLRSWKDPSPSVYRCYSNLCTNRVTVPMSTTPFCMEEPCKR